MTHVRQFDQMHLACSHSSTLEIINRQSAVRLQTLMPSYPDAITAKLFKIITFHRAFLFQPVQLF